MQITIEITDTVERTSKNGYKYHQALARLSDGVQGIVFCRSPKTAGVYEAKLTEYRIDKVRTGVRVETFVASLD